MKGPWPPDAVPPLVPEPQARRGALPPTPAGDAPPWGQHARPSSWEDDHATAVTERPADHYGESGTDDRGQQRRADQGRRGVWFAFVVGRWSLPVVLFCQVLLSARLVLSNTAFQDEGLYLWAGHLELDHFLRHAPVPNFATYFSGAPVLYPPIGAIADGIGGLAGARLLSLAFMLVATILLHGTTRRIFGSRAAAFFAAALFAGTGSTQFLGAFATYDAMALMLLCCATWLGVRSAGTGNVARVPLLLVTGLILVAANATKYASALFDPVVVIVVMLAVWQRRGHRAGLLTGAVLGGVTAGLVVAAYELSGPSYQAGIKFSTLTRAPGTTPASAVLLMSGRWVGIVALLAFAGAIAVSHAWRRWSTAALAWALAVAALLAPVEQARIDTSVSLFKHVGFGAWFAAAAAGYFLAALPNAVGRARNFTLAPLVLGVVGAAAAGTYIVSLQYRGWPDSARLTAAMRQAERPGGNYLVEDYDVEAYYLRKTVAPQQWSNTFFFGYVDPATGHYLENGPAYADAIRHRYFTAIALAFGDTNSIDQVIVADLQRYGGYRLTAQIPYTTAAGSGVYKIWTLSPPASGGSKANSRSTRKA